MRSRRKSFLPYSLAALVGVAACAVPPPETETTLVLADNQQTAEAAQTYRACLQDAARFADDRKLPISRVAILVAPMCYAQFSAWEKAEAAGLRGRSLADFQKGGDQRQLDYADNAVRTARGLASLAPDATRGQP